jgi:hypothetical protein
MESNTLRSGPRKIMQWTWMVMMVTALIVAVGKAIFG